MVESKCFCSRLAQNIGILMVFLWNRREVDFLRNGSGFDLHCGIELKEKCC